MLHTIALTLMRGITYQQTLELLRNIGNARSIFQDPDAALSTANPKMQLHLKEMLRQHGEEALHKAENELEFCERHRIRPLSLLDDDYPWMLKQCSDPPVVVFYRGSCPLHTSRFISIVGTRRITPYGKDLCRTLCADLARLLPDTTVVSGLAYGVDIHIHRACLEHRLPTIGVLAHGLDQIYPASHRKEAQAMLEEGGLLTEYVSQTRPMAGNFLRRNRIIAGMSAATIVVESAARGGALVTARLALEYSRDVFAFPGRPCDPYSEGCNALIRDRVATLVTSAEDVLQQMGWAPTSPHVENPAEPQLFPTLNDKQQHVVDALRTAESLNLDQLQSRTHLNLGVLHTALFELETNNIVQQMAGGNYRLLQKK